MVSPRFPNPEDDEVKGQKRSKHDLSMDRVFGGRYFTFNRDFLAIMSADEAVLIQHLANHYHLSGDKKKKGWFYCLSENILKELYLTPSKLTRLLRDLEERGYLKSKRVGFSPVKWYFINSGYMEKVLRYVEKEVQAGRTVPNVRYGMRPGRKSKADHNGSDN